MCCAWRRLTTPLTRFAEICMLTLPGGEKRKGQVLEVHDNKAVVQVRSLSVHTILRPSTVAPCYFSIHVCLFLNRFRE